MEGKRTIKVSGPDGFIGWLEPGDHPDTSQEVVILTDNGTRIIIPSDLLQPISASNYYLPLKQEQFEPVSLKSEKTMQKNADLKVPDDQAESAREELKQVKAKNPLLDKDLNKAEAHETLMVVPVIVEELDVQTEKTTTGKVRIVKKISERTEKIPSTFSEEVDVERVPINELVDIPPEMRVEGETTIIPVLEEVMVVEKRYRVKEEIRVTRRRKEEKGPQEVNLKREEVKVERIKTNQNK